MKESVHWSSIQSCAEFCLQRESNREICGNCSATWMLQSQTAMRRCAKDRTYNKTGATGEDSGQPVHLHSLISVFADRMCLLQPPDYPKGDINENPCYTWLKYRLIWVLAGHTGLIVSFVMSWLIYHHSQNMKIVIAPHKALISTGMHWYFSYFSPTKHILWVLVRSALLRYFYWVPTTISQRNKISYST